MAVQFKVKNSLSPLTCPIEHALLTEAVALWPCLHNLNQGAAEKRHGKIVDGVCELKKRCIVCNNPVLSYGVDYTVRDIARRAFSQGKDLEALPTHPLMSEEKKQEINLPYPGMPAVFVQTVDSWDEPFNSGAELCRKMAFKSITNDSLLTKFELLGYWDGTVSMFVKFKENNSVEGTIAHPFVCNKHIDFYITRNIADLKTIFSIIDLNNEIPAEQVDKVREIVERGCCDPVPRPARL